MPLLTTNANLAEAFAQQAYTMVGNRDREIMCEPTLLGFEVVEKNEDNSRLVGVFAFLVNREILLVPVFYLNGQCKGFDLLYRKGVNQFTLNNEKWIKYLLAQGEDQQGQAADRSGSNNRARMHLGLGEMYRNPMGWGKRASEGHPAAEGHGGGDPGALGDEGPMGIDIPAWWKEATASLTAPLAQDIPMVLHQALVDGDLGKEAAELVGRIPVIGDFMVLAGSLDAPVGKQASPTPEPESLIWHAEPEAGWPEEKVAAFYSRGWLLEDKRAAESLADAWATDDIEQRVATAHEPGVLMVLDHKGKTHKALCGALRGPDSSLPIGGELSPPELILFLDGPHKGETLKLDGLELWETPLVAEHSGEDPELEMPEGVEPKAGRRYMLWSDTLGGWAQRYDFAVYEIEKSGDGKLINGGDRGRRVVLRPDIEESDLGDTWILGADIRFFDIGKVDKSECCAPYSDTSNTAFRALTPRLVMYPPANSKAARVEVSRHNGLLDLRVGSRVVTDLTPRQAVLKLARDLRLGVPDATEIVDGLESFVWLPGKQAAFYFDDELDPDTDFDEEGYDSDLDIPVQVPMIGRQTYVTRDVEPSPEHHYLDAKGYGGARNVRYGKGDLSHIPDEVIMQMANPGLELAELGQRLGMSTLLDHGAVAALTKVFDAKSFISQYVDRMEKSLDALGRVLFLLYWKPRDFAELFGDDDLSVLENKITGVFQAYGDLVLELLQNTGDKMR